MSATVVSMRARCMPRHMCGAERERHVLLRLAEDVERVGVVPARRVAVRRRHVHRHRRALRDQHALDLDVARRRAPDAGERRLPAQALLDRLRHERAVVAQRLELVGVREQPEQEVARRAVRGLGAGREQQPQEGEDLLVGEPLAVELGLASTLMRSSRGSARRSARIAGSSRGARRDALSPRSMSAMIADELDRPAGGTTGGRRRGGRASPRSPSPGTGTSARARGRRGRGRRNCVDELVDDRAHDVGFPALHRLAGERLLDERAVARGARARPSRGSSGQ